MLSDWSHFFESVASKPFAKELHRFLDEEYKTHVVYPPRNLLFNAFTLTNPKNLKAVIIGQDPYHQPGQAMGLSFSVPRGVPLPPSLRNVYREISDDLGIAMNMENGDLTPWAKQGALLLNAYLSVRANEPLSHRTPLYEEFMAMVMRYLDELPQPIVFLLWGNFAKRYERFLLSPRHLVLKASHPSPLALSHGGWFGMHLFSKANAFLEQNDVSPIDWTIL